MEDLAKKWEVSTKRGWRKGWEVQLHIPSNVLNFGQLLAASFYDTDTDIVNFPNVI